MAITRNIRPMSIYSDCIKILVPEVLLCVPMKSAFGRFPNRVKLDVSLDSACMGHRPPVGALVLVVNSVVVATKSELKTGGTSLVRLKRELSCVHNSLFLD